MRIAGRVQGVYFRAWTAGEARARSVSGWVRNRSDGSVEALFSGPAEEVEAMIGLCRQGPPAARVENIEIFQPDSEAVPQGFSILPTR